MTKHTLEATKNVNELPSIEQTVRYIHAEAGFTKKSTGIRDIRRRNYLTWPLINIKTVTKISPESGKRQKGHMIGQIQGVCSTRTVEPPKTASTDKTNNQHEIRHDILTS